MKRTVLFNFILFLAFVFSTPAFAASINSSKNISAEKNINSKAEIKKVKLSKVKSRISIGKQEKFEKKLDRFQKKLNNKIAKLKKNGKFNASLDLKVISLIVMALGGLFILLGLAIPLVGFIFIIIGGLIAFVGLVMLLLLDGVKVSTSSPSH